MAIHAYDELYLSNAQNILGHAADFAIMTLGVDPSLFGNALAVTEAAKQFAAGNPRYVAGMNGCELAREMLDEARVSHQDADDAMYLDKSPEYWSGWTLAYYQWYAGCSFMEILSAISFDQILQMYPLYHEMDITQFVDQMDAQMRQASTQTKLRQRRDTCGMSQSDLARDADVPLRQIQLFEQGQRDINKTSAVTLFKLSKALHCKMEDLLERSSL